MASTGQQGTKRRRAARACLSCRTRKVRCDVSRSGPPCMNCSLDDIECVVKARKPKSSSRLGPRPPDPQETVFDDSPEADNESEPEIADAPAGGNAIPDQSAIEGNVATEVNPPSNLVAEDRPGKGIPDNSSNAMDFAYEAKEESPPVNVDSTNLLYGGVEVPPNPPPVQTQTPYLANDWFSSCLPDAGSTCPQPDISTARHYSLLHPNSVFYHYYPFLTLDNLYNCMPQDVDFMEAEGCFHLPTRQILDQIIRQYFLHVHPLLPLLNEGDFWEMYYNKRPEGEEPGPKLSLLVFQAIMFASCNFVNWSMESARSFGFKSLRSLRAAFYRRAKLLYDFGAESSPVAIAQAALLLSYWTPSVRVEMKLNTVWLSVAIQNARNAEAPYYASLPTPSCSSSSEAAASSNKAKTVEAKRYNLLKRLWWCCIIRDRIMPLGLRRGIQITRAHFDFDSHAPLGVADLDDEINRSLVYTPEAKRELAQVLTHVVHLCVILTDVLLLVFPLDGALDQARGRLMLMPLEEVEIRKNKQALMLWYRGATSASVQPSANGGADIDWNKHDSVVLFTHVMYTYYHSARMALYHYELQHYLALMATTATMDSQKIRETREAIQNSLANVTENFRRLNRRHLTRWLPISMLAFVALPLALHVLNTHLSASAARQSSSREEALVEAMKSLQLQYDGVDWVAKVIRKLIDQVQDEAASTAVTNWSELLFVKPRTYLRMSLALDISMSTGRFPDKETVLARLEMAEALLQQRQQQQQQQQQQMGSKLAAVAAQSQNINDIAHLRAFGRGAAAGGGGGAAVDVHQQHQRHSPPGDDGATVLSSSSQQTSHTSTSTHPSLPDVTAPPLLEDFSPFGQGTVDMTTLFDSSCLADFGMDTGSFAVPGLGGVVDGSSPGMGTPQVDDNAALSGQCGQIQL